MQHNAALKRTWTQFEGRQERTAQEREEELSWKKDKCSIFQCSKICLVCIWCETMLKGSWTIRNTNAATFFDIISNQTLRMAEWYQVVSVTFYIIYVSKWLIQNNSKEKLSLHRFLSWNNLFCKFAHSRQPASYTCLPEESLSFFSPFSISWYHLQKVCFCTHKLTDRLLKTFEVILSPGGDILYKICVDSPELLKLYSILELRRASNGWTSCDFTKSGTFCALGRICVPFLFWMEAEWKRLFTQRNQAARLQSTSEDLKPYNN